MDDSGLTKREEARRWVTLHAELKHGLDAGDSEFVRLEIGEILAEARRRKAGLQ
jgi:hypothetical protein